MNKLPVWAAILGFCFAGLPAPAGEPGGAPPRAFRVGAFAADVTPVEFPVTINGGFLSASAGKANDRLHVRWLVLDDGATRVALGVLDTCVIPREFADEVKARAREATGIPPERIMLSATHTHSAPSLMRCLGTDADPRYPAFALPRIVAGLQRAVEKLAPAQVGWATAQAPQQTYTRVWIRRPDRMLRDPFGELSVRANMHPGHMSPDAIGPSGPRDPELTLLAAQTPAGRPVAIFANFSMHYFGAAAVSADYYGAFAEKLRQLVAAEADSPFVGIMSQGTSGDQHWMDYSQPRRKIDRDGYAEELARIAQAAYQTVRFHDWVPLAMREQELRIATRQPDEKRLAWARELVAQMGDRPPRSQPEVYAREQLWLHENPTRPVKLQSLRVGELGIAIWPCEVFALSGLKIKAQSPLQPTMNIELANAEEGYIPPPELYPLGGYNTWPCRSAGLEVQAEPKIVETLLGLLEDVSGKPRRKLAALHGAYAQAVLAARPLAYWRCDEFGGPVATDASGNDRHAAYEPGIARYLEGPAPPAFSGADAINRAVHLAGGRLTASIKELGETYSVELWFYNGLPADARPVTGHLFGRGGHERLAIGGTAAGGGKLLFAGAEGEPLIGRTTVAARAWNYVALVREGPRAAVYLNGNPAAEIAGQVAPVPRDAAQLFVGGRNDREATFEGKVDEIAVYGRALLPEEVARHYQLAGVGEPAAAAPPNPGARP